MKKRILRTHTHDRTGSVLNFKWIDVRVPIEYFKSLIRKKDRQRTEENTFEMRGVARSEAIRRFRVQLFLCRHAKGMRATTAERIMKAFISYLSCSLKCAVSLSLSFSVSISLVLFLFHLSCPLPFRFLLLDFAQRWIGSSRFFYPLSLSLSPSLSRSLSLACSLSPFLFSLCPLLLTFNMDNCFLN